MPNWFQKLFTERRKFHIPEGLNLPSCHVRLLDDADIDRCLLIYELNEGGNFSGGHETFRKVLREPETMFLVCEVEGEIRAMGGMSRYRVSGEDFAVLSYGMVHPDHQNQGYGSLMILSRLSVLPLPREEWTVTMSSVAKKFHGRFGFYELRQHRDDDGNRMCHMLVYVGRNDIATFRKALEDASVSIQTGGEVIRVSNLPQPETNLPQLENPTVEQEDRNIPPARREQISAGQFFLTLALVIVFIATFWVLAVTFG